MKLKSLILLPGFAAVCLYSQLTLADNWLLGIEGGYASRSGTLNSRTEPSVAFGSQHLSDNGGVYGVLGGYQWNLDDHWLAGLEANFDWNSMDELRAFNYVAADGVTPVGEGARYDRDWTLGLSGRLGYRVHTQALPFDMLPYVRVGAEVNDDELTIERYATLTGALTNSNTRDKHTFAWLAGAGIEFPLIDHLVLRGEYDYSRSQRVKLENVSANTAGTIFGSYDYRPHTHTGKLQLVWNFC